MSWLEKLTRSNIYLYLVSKYLYQNYLYRFFYEKEFQILRFIKKNDKIILDIGSNNGVSARSIRLFNKTNMIISFEPNKFLKKKLEQTQKKIINFKFYLFGVLDKNKKIDLFIPFYKNYSLDAQSSIKLTYVIDSLRRGIFHKKLIKKIKIKKIRSQFKTIDNFNFKPFFIKVDTEGTEHLVLNGLKKTIKKFKPILMIEKNDMNFFILNKILKKMNYELYSFKNKKLKKYKFKKHEHLNLICINRNNKDLIKIFF